MSAAQPEDAPPTYAERLWPGALGWLFVLGFAGFGFIALRPVSVPAAAAGAALLGAAAIGVAAWTATAVRVHDGELRVGRAHIPATVLGEVEVLDRAGVRAALGPGSDARVYACVRAWIPGAVRVTVVDPSDPTPAWLVSTRRPQALAAAVRAAGAGDQAAHSVQTI